MRVQLMIKGGIVFGTGVLLAVAGGMLRTWVHEGFGIMIGIGVLLAIIGFIVALVAFLRDGSSGAGTTAAGAVGTADQTVGGVTETATGAVEGVADTATGPAAGTLGTVAGVLGSLPGKASGVRGRLGGVLGSATKLAKGATSSALPPPGQAVRAPAVPRAPNRPASARKARGTVGANLAFKPGKKPKL